MLMMNAQNAEALDCMCGPLAVRLALLASHLVTERRALVSVQLSEGSWEGKLAVAVVCAPS